MVGRRLQPCIAQVACALLIVLGFVGAVPARADISLAPIGGPGGGVFSQRCPANRILFGVELLTGDDADAARPICATALAPDHVTNDASEGPFHGGPGGAVRITCPLVRPVVLGMYVAYEGRKTLIVNNVHLFCGQVTDTNQALAAAPDAVYDGPDIRTSGGLLATFISVGNNAQQCPAGQVAVGINGRSGIWLDAVGLICGASPIASAPPPPPPPPASFRPAVCRALDHELARPTPNAATVATLKTGCARASPPPAPCRALVGVLQANGTAATVQTLNNSCLAARKALGLP